jgi:hypothetical protein
MVYGILGFFIIILGVLMMIMNRKLQDLNSRIYKLQGSLKNISVISRDFPDFIKRGENISKNLTSDLMIKEKALKRLIDEAQKSKEYLEYLEEKNTNRDNNLNREMISKILILVNQGFNLKEISESLNIPIGEVELIVNLRRFSDAGEEGT